MNLNIPELERIEEKLDKLLAAAATRDFIPEWSSLKTAWEIKGGCALRTLRDKRALQPKGGRYDSYVSGVGVWSRETIAEWLSITDDRLEAYNQKYRTGCQIPARQLSASRRIKAPGVAS
jgi:hypothetical protein